MQQLTTVYQEYVTLCTLGDISKSLIKQFGFLW